MASPVKRKGKYASDTFLRRGDAVAWARKLEHTIDRGDPILCDHETTKSFANLIDLHCMDPSRALTFQILLHRLSMWAWLRHIGMLPTPGSPSNIMDYLKRTAKVA